MRGCCVGGGIGRADVGDLLRDSGKCPGSDELGSCCHKSTPRTLDCSEGGSAGASLERHGIDIEDTSGEQRPRGPQIPDHRLASV